MTTQQLHQLGESHRAEFQSFALQLTKDEERAKDLLQDAIYLAIKHRAGFQPGTNFRAWVKTIIRNSFLTAYRRSSRRSGLIAKDRPSQGWLSAGHVANRAESTLGAEEIMTRIERLPRIYREAFLLQFRGVKHKDIARRMGVPVGTIKSRVHTARRILSEQLSDYRID